MFLIMNSKFVHVPIPDVGVFREFMVKITRTVVDVHFATKLKFAQLVPLQGPI